MIKRTKTNFRFHGQHFIEETGLYYNWWTWYKRETGRYMEVDRFMKINREYLYSKSNSINNYDFLGLYSCPTGWHDCANLSDYLRKIADEIYYDEDIIVPYQEGCYCKFCYCICYKNAEKGDPDREIAVICECKEYKSKNCRVV
ncbi:MAG: hypothetical protein N2746_06015 [Deltaproteobacteria bacterium]|nr:hypothetical protein [Deltaproteobacteria bacterium]